MLNRKDPTYLRLMNSAKWKYLRRDILMKNPLCQMCFAKGIIATAKEIHHIKPIQTGVTDYEKEFLAYDRKNLIALCHKCHVEQHKQLGKQSKAERERRNKKMLDAFKKNFLE